MKKGYCVTICKKEPNGFEIIQSYLAMWGIFLKETDARAKADELNEVLKESWKRQVSTHKETVERDQERWDLLAWAGLEQGPRPELLGERWVGEWEPGKGGEEYHSVHSVIIYDSGEGRE